MHVGACYVQELTAAGRAAPVTTLNVSIKSCGIHTSPSRGAIGHRTQVVRNDHCIIVGNSQFPNSQGNKHIMVPSDIHVFNKVS